MSDSLDMALSVILPVGLFIGLICLVALVVRMVRRRLQGEMSESTKNDVLKLLSLGVTCLIVLWLLTHLSVIGQWLITHQAKSW